MKAYNIIMQFTPGFNGGTVLSAAFQNHITQFTVNMQNSNLLNTQQIERALNEMLQNYLAQHSEITSIAVLRDGEVFNTLLQT